jgi:hypothetical protein
MIIPARATYILTRDMLFNACVNNIIGIINDRLCRQVTMKELKPVSTAKERINTGPIGINEVSSSIRIITLSNITRYVKTHLVVITGTKRFNRSNIKNTINIISKDEIEYIIISCWGSNTLA